MGSAPAPLEAAWFPSRRRHGETNAAAAVAFWRQWSAAFREFPFHADCVYNAPLQVGPADPLWPTPTGYEATMVGIPYDDLDGWRAIYPAEVFAAQLEKVAAGFESALASPAIEPRSRSVVGSFGELHAVQ